MSATNAVTRPNRERTRLVAVVRRMGSRPARHHGRALSRRPLSQSRILRLDIRAVLGAARRLALRRHGGRHDVRSGQQGARPFRRLDLWPDRDLLRHAVRAELFRPRRHDRRHRLSCPRPRHRPDQRLSRHRSGGAGVHRDPHDPFHRPRNHPGPDRRQEYRVRAQGGQIPHLLPHRRDQRAGLQQPDHRVRDHCRDRRRRSRLYLLWLDDLRDRRERAGRPLRRHQYALRPDALLCAVLALRGHRRIDESRAEQGRRPGVRPWRRARRHRLGDRRRHGDLRRPRARDRIMPRRDPGRPDRQGVARRRADHPRHSGRRREDGSRRDLATAARRGAGVSRRHPDRCGAHRAVAGAPAHSRSRVGAAARPAAAGHSRSWRHRHLRRADARHDVAIARPRQTRDCGVLLPARCGGRDAASSRCGCSASGRGRISGRGSTIRSRYCWRFPRSRCSPSASPSSWPTATSIFPSGRCWRFRARPPPSS